MHAYIYVCMFFLAFHFSLLCMIFCGVNDFSIKWNNFPIDWSNGPLLVRVWVAWYGWLGGCVAGANIYPRRHPPTHPHPHPAFIHAFINGSMIVKNPCDQRHP